MRVGLVGSTGSGKSTLALSLFRAVDPSGGSIEIDGMDIASVALHELRGRLNMVVQDGSLCSGTLREALDITGTKGKPHLTLDRWGAALIA
jgi:ABC-type multidrug transport system fused ATPase/permease subunit